jgi:hypothetical protein
MPECIHWQDQVPDWQGQDINQHPENIDHLPRRNHDENGWQPKDGDEQQERDCLFERLWRCYCYPDNKSICERNRNWKNDRAEKIHKNNELHTEAERSTQVTNEDEFHEVVDRRIDPATAL